MPTNHHNNTHPCKPPEIVHGNKSPKLHDHYEIILNWYKINSKNKTGEEALPNLHIKSLMSILGDPLWNHVYHCWQIELKHMQNMQPYVQHIFDPAKFVYFIEAYNREQR